MSLDKRQFMGAALAALASASMSKLALAQAPFPTRDLNGIIQFGAGGGTDISMRGYAPHAERVLGRNIVLSNRPGAAGAIAANFVLRQPADGYTLLMGAEPQALFRVMGVADFDYNEFFPVNIAAMANTILLVTRPDAPWNTMQDILSYVQANPRRVRQYLSGIGTVPFTVNLMISSLTRFETIMVPFDGDGPAIAALQGGHLDIGFLTSAAAIDHVRAGRLKALGVLSDQPFQGIAPMTNAPSLAGLPRFLPWGAWFGVFVRREVPDAAKERLVAAFREAGNNPDYRRMMEGRGNTMLNIGGDEAQRFINRWVSTTAWLYQDAGQARVNPETLGIPRPR